MNPVALGAILTFVAVGGAIVGSYWLLVLMPESRDQQAVRGRLKPEKRTKALSGAGLLNEAKRLSQLGIVDRVLRQSGSIASPIENLIAQSGWKTSVSVVLLTCGCVALAVYVAVLMLVGRWWVALPAGLIAAYGPIAVLRFKRNRRVLRLEEQFPEAMDLIARALRAGHAFTTGLAMAADELGDPLGSEFRLLYERQNFGMPLPNAMREFAARIPVLDAKFFATAVLTQRESGGNLAEVLDNLSSVIRERFRVKRQVRVISAHGRMTGWILALLPPSLAVAFMLVSPGHIQMLIGDELGIRMIAGALLLQFIGTIAIRKIVRIEY